MSNFTPKNGRILVKPDEKKHETTGGIIIPDSRDDEKPTTGVVVVGNDEYKEGSRVLFNKFSYDEFELEGEKHYTVAASLILGVF